jgi:hypothetical protein
MTDPDLRWRKAKASGSGQGSCVEVAALGASFAVRDSKDPGGPVLRFASSDWSAFVSAAGSDSL